MRYATRFTVVSLGIVALLSGCAHTQEDGVIAKAPSDLSLAPGNLEPEAALVDNSAPESLPMSRPRLSQTITLGQGTEWQYTPGPATGAPPAAPGSTVIVNNNIVVEGNGPGYGYGYGGYAGYGVGRGFGGYGRPTTVWEGSRGNAAQRGTSQWGTTGWEGARRTAAPGHTPGVGGNWSPAPSYGPAPMR